MSDIRLPADHQGQLQIPLEAASRLSKPQIRALQSLNENTALLSSVEVQSSRVVVILDVRDSEVTSQVARDCAELLRRDFALTHVAEIPPTDEEDERSQWVFEASKAKFIRAHNAIVAREQAQMYAGLPE